MMGTKNWKIWASQLLLCITMLIALFSVCNALADDRIIINGSSCKVTEEDVPTSSDYYLPPTSVNDLYLRVDFPDSHWRFGLRNAGLKGLSMVDVSLQAGQFTAPQYIIKHGGLADIFVPDDDG